jgi:hypothetical protein
MKTKLLLIFFIINCLLINLKAQNNEFSAGYLKTQLEKNAANIAIDIGKDIAKTITNDASLFLPGKNSFFEFSPDIKVLVSSDDGFNGILAKYTGSIVFFQTEKVPGTDIITPATEKFMPIIPISGGFETDKNFYYLNGLLETGFIPWYQNINSLPKVLRQTKLGIFVQGGYKYKMTDLPDSLITTNAVKDDSKEKLDKGIFRVKASIGFEPTFILNDLTGLGFALIGASDTWYDIINSEFYYKISGKLRFMINKKYNLDFKYEKGSGAPNFNKGNQFGTSLTISF